MLPHADHPGFAVIATFLVQRHGRDRGPDGTALNARRTHCVLVGTRGLERLCLNDRSGND
ncbi:hypothetical protein QMZ92_01915 [Streptomyces sp. HNM0645]|uniref:hypothetical protein n=1 Tax=Streptomyces sp. HNM0645 TaxID=2782343 RepID=UPI0024B69865|nr:hypothetical protein [Streptomyces sp. HNM0645]MDI9883186.1 hypothetical protein [Streptomyces sp. HNM0645]